MEISGKLALVTGGTDGIGLKIAQQLKARGARVIVCGRRQDRLDAALAEEFEAIAADLSNVEGVDTLFKHIRARDLDIVINNAGVGEEYILDDVIDLDATDRSIFLNLNAPMRLIALLIPQLRTRPAAMIVNVTSGLAIAPSINASYCATKAGLRSFTASIRAQMKGSNIIVAEALPPLVDTAMTSHRAGAKMTAQECARQIVEGIARGKTEIYVGQVKLLRFIFGLSPRLAQNIMLRF